MTRLPLQFKRDGIIYWPFGRYGSGRLELQYKRAVIVGDDCNEELALNIAKQFYDLMPVEDYWTSFMSLVREDWNFDIKGCKKDTIDEAFRKSIYAKIYTDIPKRVNISIDDDFYYTLAYQKLTYKDTLFNTSRKQILWQAERMEYFHATEPR